MKEENIKESHHHDLLQLEQSIEVSPPLQELAGGDEVAAACFQARVKFFQDALHRAETAPLQTGLQHTLQKNLIRALLSRDKAEKCVKLLMYETK